MFTAMMSTAKREQLWLLTLMLGAHSLGRGPRERGSNSNAEKKKGVKSLIYVYWTYCIPKTFL